MTIRSRLLILLLPTLIAFVILISFFSHFNSSREIMFAGSFLTLLLVTMAVFLIADKISKPVRQLNQAALEIAAGDYEANIKVEGPKEIVELAQNLNIMSQCLVEHMSRLKESSMIRERMYGEYECALLLQHYMLQKVIDDYALDSAVLWDKHTPPLRMLLISIPLPPLQRGLLLNISNLLAGTSLALLEAPEPGFSGLFQLIQWTHLPEKELQDKSFIKCRFSNGFHSMNWKAHDLFPPLVWSIKSQQFISGTQQEIPLENQDMIFLYNSSLIEQFETEEAIKRWFARVLRHFAEDGLETIQTMLTNELTFLAKRQHTKHNFKILSLQISLPESH